MAYNFNSQVPQVLEELKRKKAQALEIIGGLAEGYAKRLCPTKTSNLKNSITHQQEGEDTEIIGTNVKYAPYVELGHHQTPGRYVPAIKKRLVRDYVPGKPFLKPAAEGHQQEYGAIIDRVLKS